jgi:Tfp pilus assembly protein PilN
MRAVNLLPSDLRASAPASARGTRPERERVEGSGAYVVLGALVLCLAMLAAYVLTSNTVEQKQSDLAAVTAEADATVQAAAKLKPYADFEAMAKARVETVRGLAAARFDWEQALRDLSRAVPAEVKLESLTGDMGLAGTGGGGGNELRGSIQAPAISLDGCANTQRGVARLMARLRGVDGVTRVSLSKSEKTATGDSGSTESVSPCSGANPPSFSIVVFFERSAALAAIATPAADAATAPGVPVPNAVSGSTTPAQDPNSAQAQASNSGGSSTPTSTTGEVAP